MSNLKNLLEVFPLPPSPLYGDGFDAVEGRVVNLKLVLPPAHDEKALTDALEFAKSKGLTLAELGLGALVWNLGSIAEATTIAHSFGIGIIARNPMLTSGPQQIMAHNNTIGVIVERACGTPAGHAELRERAHRTKLLPVWFVYDGPEGAQQCAEQIQHGHFVGMSVYYRAAGALQTVLTPYV